MKRIAILGTGFIGRFYTEALHGQRNSDKVVMVYGRKAENAENFATEFDVPYWTTDMEIAIRHDEVDAVVIALPNNIHLEAVMMCARFKKPVLCTKPLGRNAQEAKKMLLACEKAGVFHGYLEDLCFTPKFLKSLASIQAGSLGRILWARSRETHPGPHSSWFWDIEQAGGGAILDLGCHCIEISRNFIGKDIRPVEVMCWADTQVKPIPAEDHAIGLVKYENGAIGQFEVSWTFRGGLDLRDEVMGTEGTIWLNNFLRTGFEMFTTGKGGYVAEKSESDSGWIFPVGDEVHELGYTNMFTDMFNALEDGKGPSEDFYDGYVVNAIIDACYKSSKTRKWEPVKLDIWRGKTGVKKESGLTDYDDQYYLIKEEILPSGQKKVILKDKISGEISEK